MERRIGGRRLRDILKNLRSEIEDHLGSITEIRDGLRKLENLLPKPEELTRYEQIKSTGLPLVPGGLLDQPHIWLMQWNVIESVIAEREAIERMAESMPPAKDLMAPMRFGK